jgi:ABC-type multidrug transport system fused ATPase/permease subunit
VWQKIKISWSFLHKREKRYFILLAMGRIFNNALDIVGIGSIGLLVMAVASGRIDFSIGPISIQFDETPFSLIVTLIAFAAGAFLLKALFGLAMAYANLWLLAGIEVRNSKRVLDYLLNGSLGDLRKYSRADIQFATGLSTGAMFGGLLGAVSNMITEIFLMIMIVGMFFLVDPTAATAISVYIFAFIVVIQFIIGKKLKEIGRAVMKGSIATSSAVLDAVESFKEVSVLRRQTHFVGKFTIARMLLAKTKARELFLRAVPRIIIEQSLMLGVLGFVGWQVIAGDLTSNVASVGVFIAGSVRLMGAILPIQNSYASLKSTHLKADMAMQILEKHRAKSGEPDERKARRALREQPLVTGIREESGGGVSITATNVSYAYPDSSEYAVKNVNIEVKEGDFVALVGPSGAGKTTMADLLLGLHRPTEGTVLIDGRPPVEVRQTDPGLISYVPQKPGMVEGTIGENVALGVDSDSIDRDQVWRALELAGLKAVVEEIPGGIDSDLGKQSDALSGGQLQRLGLARALYPNPRVIILDEATSALDAKTEAEVTNNIRSLKNHVTIVVIAHRLSTVQHADCVYAMDGGRVVGSGPFKKVRKEVPMIEEYVQLMSFED